MTIIAIILFIIYCLIIVLSTIGFVLLFPKRSNTKPITGFSIIIPARNEAINIIACLESIRNNKTNCNFEIIVINDFSTDDTAVLVEAFFKQYPIGSLLQLSDYINADERINAFKKKAIEIAIAQSKYEWILQTDADCIVNPQWIQTIYNTAVSSNLTCIAAPVSLLPLNNSWKQKILFWFQSIDFLTMQGITVATHYYQVGQMCNGANFAYSKAAFYEVGGFQGIDGIASGDDMLLLHKFTTSFPQSTTFLKSQAVIVHTASQNTWNGFLQQRIRWSSKADQYKDKRLTFILGFVYLFNLSIVVLFILGIFNVNYLNLALILFVGKVALEYILVIPSAIFFNKINQLIVFPLLQPLHILYIIMAGFLGKFGTYKWKDRTVK